MISQNKLLTYVYEYIAETVGCTVSQLKSDETIFVMNPAKKENYIKILGIGDVNIISLSEDVHAHVKKLLAGKNRDELFESELIYGQTLRYIPDIKQMIPFTYPKEYAFEILESLDIQKLRGLKGFDNSLSFDEEGNTNTGIVLYAKKDGEIIAVAGAACETNEIMEVGIDVKKSYRGEGLAKLLVHNLSVEILKRNKIPFYSASVTNLASQSVAVRSGYKLLWTDSYGVR